VPRARTILTDNPSRLIACLEKARANRADQKDVESILSALETVRIDAAGPLIALHDLLLYFGAYPSRPSIRRLANRQLRTLAARIERLASAGADVSAFDKAEHSGIAGTSITMAFSFDLLRSVALHSPGSVRIAWELYDDAERLGATLPRFLPLLDEEALVDANIPYAEWLDAARRGNRHGSLPWLLDRFEGLAISPADRGALFDSLALPIEWKLGRSRWSRTSLKIPASPGFFHGSALLSRRNIDLDAEIAGPALPVRRLPENEGAIVLDVARAALATRYREFYAFNSGDPAGALEADAGRGVRIYFFGLPPNRRLPLRAGFAELVTRNGIPVGYGDGFALFERVDLSFNIFPEFRDGETAFIFARLLKLYRQILGVGIFSIDPYQIGFQNEEAIESGAFWFYRRLGFRHSSPRLEQLAQREESRLAADRAYRTPARLLRRLAASNLMYAGPGCEIRNWARFHIRRLGFAVQRRMAAEKRFAVEFRERSASRLARLLPNCRPRSTALRRRAFADWALVLNLIPDLARWSAEDLELLAKIIEEKTARSEAGYVHLLQRHARLRSEVIRLGSRT
jgi:hypothetical protein